MKKKLLSVLMVLCLMLAMVPAALADGDTDNTPAGTQEDPFTTAEQYKNATENGQRDDQDVWLVVEGEENSHKQISTGEFNLGNVQSHANPPRLHLIIRYCDFTGNTSGDGTNSSFMYLPNCKQLVIEHCKFNAGESGLDYGINWNLIQVTGATVEITDCTFEGKYENNAIKLNQRNGADDSAKDVKGCGVDNLIPASIASATITDCTFSGTNAIIALGSKAKFDPAFDPETSDIDQNYKEELTGVSPSTGAFPVKITDTDVTVRLDYLASKDDTAETVEVTQEQGYDVDGRDVIVEKLDPEASIGNAYFDTLQQAINAAKNGETITLLKDVDLTVASDEDELTIPANKKITIDGQGHFGITAQNTTDVESGTGSDHAILLLKDNSDLTLSNITLNFSGTVGESRNYGDGIDVGSGSKLTMKNANVTLDSLYRSFIMGKMPTVTLDNTVMIVSNIYANASNGGIWVIENGSNVSYEKIGNHALSTDQLTISDSDVSIVSAGYLGIYGSEITIEGGASVIVTDCAKSTSLPTGYVSKGAVQLKGDNGKLTIDNSRLVLANNGNGTTAKDLYIGSGTLETKGNYSLDANIVVVGENATTYSTVTYVSNDVAYPVLQIANGSTHTVIAAPTRSGYTFGGWRSGYTTYQPGDVITVNGDMTLTAVWNAITVGPTYDITVADSANGSVSTSLKNASQGSVITVTVDPDEGYVLGSLAVTGPDGSVDVTRVNSTTYRFTMPDGDVTVRATFTVEGLPFTDVATGAWYYDAVVYVYNNGLMDGVSTTQFNPDGTMTRAMVWAILARIDGETVTGSNWAADARAWAMAEGVSDGENPNVAVTREQLVTMLWRYAGSPAATGSLSTWSDAASVSDWASDAMVWAINNGVITGMSATTIAPSGTATRAQCAAILMRSADLLA